ncbi:unnamed protein product [Adineta ricciae]|uniref:Glycoside hydrolase family 5 domain-containing protein n=1 Tax=Adineta ricciae TaxID=249248 RepID=A0A814MME6_ADIRI|nr:unnamed protein product [Adineta ricciae]CAF1342408.1 unnamed protein product [Adineta ricciae]
MRIVLLLVSLFGITSPNKFVSFRSNQTYLRGTNYIPLLNGTRHALFEPSLYSTWKIEDELTQMKIYGYNYVRVFLSCPYLYSGFGLSSPGISINYTKNLVDFLLRASNHQISVMLTGDFNPLNYQSIINSYPLPANVTGINLIVFHRGQIAAKAQFFQDLLSQIRLLSQIAFENIFAIDIFNEISISVHCQPFSLTNGFVSFEDILYDMSKGIDRQQLLDIAGNIWMDSIVKAIKFISSNISVTASLFSPNAVGHDGFDGVEIRPVGADDRYPLRSASLIKGLADYTDLHVYASNNVQKELEGAALSREKPILMGETGAYTGDFPNASIAALAIKKVIIDSFNYRFNGWGIWTWNSVDQIPRFWTLTEQNNTINKVLSPSFWPIG